MKARLSASPFETPACGGLLRMRLAGAARALPTLMVRRRAAPSRTMWPRSGFILRDAAQAPLLRMRSETLMVRSAASPRVSNHEATNGAAYFALLQSGRIAPETPANAPSASSATSSRL